MEGYSPVNTFFTIHLTIARGTGSDTTPPGCVTPMVLETSDRKIHYLSLKSEALISIASFLQLWVITRLKEYRSGKVE